MADCRHGDTAPTPPVRMAAAANSLPESCQSTPALSALVLRCASGGRRMGVIGKSCHSARRWGTAEMSQTSPVSDLLNGALVRPRRPKSYPVQCGPPQPRRFERYTRPVSVSSATHDIQQQMCTRLLTPEPVVTTTGGSATHHRPRQPTMTAPSRSRR